MHVAARRADVGRVALVILDVAGAFEPRQVVRALELGEQIRRRLAKHVDEHVQAAAMRHADDDLVHAGFAGSLNEIVERRNQRFAAFEREAFLADEARIQITLDTFGASQAIENRRLLFASETPMNSARLELLAQPEPLSRARHVRELRGELAAVDLLQERQDVLELHARVARTCQPTRRELALQVRLVQSQEVEAQHGRSGTIPQSERIEIRDLMAAQTVDLDQPRDSRLFLDRRSGLGSGDGSAARRGTLPHALGYGLNDRPVRNFGARRR